MYPIARFIEATMIERGISRGALASALGYRNASKALRHLDRFTHGCLVPLEFQTRLVGALGVDPADFAAAVQATRDAQREQARREAETEMARARAAFRPHLRVIPERSVPQPIFVAAVTGVNFWLVTALPEDILAMPVVRQIDVAGETARTHFAKANGRAGPFGAIRGYLFRTGFESAIELATDGTVRGPRDGIVAEPKAFLTIKT